MKNQLKEKPEEEDEEEKRIFTGSHRKLILVLE